MNPLRALLKQHRALAGLLVALALCMKALVPAGFMVAQESRIFSIQLCDDGAGHLVARQLVIPMKGDAGESKPVEHKTDVTCPFSALSMGSLSAVDPALLALAIAFVLALGFAAVVPIRPARVFHLRPPLRGPPALA